MVHQAQGSGEVVELGAARLVSPPAAQWAVPQSQTEMGSSYTCPAAAEAAVVREAHAAVVAAVVALVVEGGVAEEAVVLQELASRWEKLELAVQEDEGVWAAGPLQVEVSVMD